MLLGKIIKKQNGLTLVETLLALAIASLTVTYLATLFPFGLKATMVSREETLAVALAQAKIEELISKSYVDVAAATTTEANLNALSPDFSNFGRTAVVGYVDSDLNPSALDNGIKKISVTVFWQNKLSQATSSLSLFSLISDYQ